MNRRPLGPLNQERLMQFFAYNADTGVFTFKTRHGGVDIGQSAGSVCRRGYIYISIDGKKFAAHRLAWLYVYGEFPHNEVDHINRVKSDNRICNLRAVTRLENRQNITAYRNNTSGFKGVTWHKAGKKWCAQIQVSGKNRHLGLYKNIEDAKRSYIKAAAELHKYNSVLTMDAA